MISHSAARATACVGSVFEQLSGHVQQENKP